jgi:hypothetical protein
MRVEVKTNAADVGRWLMGNTKKVKQAGAKALSQTVLQVQHAERVELNREFTVRKAAFMRNRVKIFRFPKWNQDGGLVAVIGINDKVKGSPLLLSVFEDGGAKSPVSGSRIAIPLTGGKARPSFRKGVPASMRMDRLGLHSDAKTRQVKGQKRTFILPTRSGEYVLMQRGPGARSTGEDKNISPLYLFRNHVKLKKRLKFVKVAHTLAEEQLPKLFTRYLKLYLKE